MTVPGTVQAAPSPHGVDPPTGTLAGRCPVAPLSPDHRVPDAVLTALQEAAGTHRRITSALLKGLDERFHIEQRYGVSNECLRSYLRRVRAAYRNHRGPDPHTDDPKHAEGKAWGEKVKNHRRRQASVAAILDRIFGPMAKSNPHLWDRRAYLMLVGLVYERLAGSEDIPTDELVALAKVLAEGRRVEARLRETGQPAQACGPDRPATGGLPEDLTDVVRQVYGTNFQIPADG